VVSFTAVPAPALSGGTTPIIDSVAGLVAKPRPAAIVAELKSELPMELPLPGKAEGIEPGQMPDPIPSTELV